MISYGLNLEVMKRKAPTLKLAIKCVVLLIASINSMRSVSQIVAVVTIMALLQMPYIWVRGKGGLEIHHSIVERGTWASWNRARQKCTCTASHKWGQNRSHDKYTYNVGRECSHYGYLLIETTTLNCNGQGIGIWSFLKNLN